MEARQTRGRRRSGAAATGATTARFLPWQLSTERRARACARLAIDPPPGVCSARAVVRRAGRWRGLRCANDVGGRGRRPAAACAAIGRQKRIRTHDRASRGTAEQPARARPLVRIRLVIAESCLRSTAPVRTQLIDQHGLGVTFIVDGLDVALVDGRRR